MRPPSPQIRGIDMSDTHWTRREFIEATTFFGLALGLPMAGAALVDLPEDEVPSKRQREMMRLVSEAVIPDSDTPGAGKAAVGDFVIFALAHGLDGTRQPASSAEMPWGFPEQQRRDGSLRYLDWLEHRLDHDVNGDWVGRDEQTRSRILAALDDQAFAGDAGEHPWKKLKGLVLTGYYTSQIGGSQELRFELVPGRFDPRVPQTADTRAYSSDWTAVEFG